MQKDVTLNLNYRRSVCDFKEKGSGNIIFGYILALVK